MTSNFSEDRLHKLFESFGSPLFICSENALRKQYRLLSDSLRNNYADSAIAYSFKTNYLPKVCKVLKEEGALAEVVSGFEYDLAKKLGYRGPQIIFNGPLKLKEELKTAFKDGAVINVDNMEELLKIKNLSEDLGTKLSFGVRLNSQHILGSSEEASGWLRFGFNVESGEAEKACDYADCEGLKIIGYHIHFGSNISDMKFYGRAAEVVAEFVLKMKRKIGTTPTYLDFGGGFAEPELKSKDIKEWNVPLVNDFILAITSVLKRKLGSQTTLPKLIIEPGRFLVGKSFILATRVISAKFSRDIQKVTVDASINVLPTARLSEHKIYTPQKEKGFLKKVETVVFGSSCMSNDVLGQLQLPPLKEGDILVFENCGAYSISRSSQFIYPRPAVLWVNSYGIISVARKKEEYSDMLHLDLFA